jgi:hypothetical protein
LFTAGGAFIVWRTYAYGDWLWVWVIFEYGWWVSRVMSFGVIEVHYLIKV